MLLMRSVGNVEAHTIGVHEYRVEKILADRLGAINEMALSCVCWHQQEQRTVVSLQESK